MKTVQVTQYVADDGKTFETAEACITYESIVLMVSILEGLGIDWRDAGPAEIAYALDAAGYTITQKVAP